MICLKSMLWVTVGECNHWKWMIPKILTELCVICIVCSAWIKRMTVSVSVVSRWWENNQNYVSKFYHVHFENNTHFRKHLCNYLIHYIQLVPFLWVQAIYVSAVFVSKMIDAWYGKQNVVKNSLHTQKGRLDKMGRRRVCLSGLNIYEWDSTEWRFIYLLWWDTCSCVGVVSIWASHRTELPSHYNTLQ